MKVTRGNYLIKVDKIEATSKMFELTDEDKKISDRATVIAVGPDSVVEVGDRVVFNNRSGRFVVLDEKEYMLVADHDIFIILDNKETK